MTIELELNRLSPEELERGWEFDRGMRRFTCLTCGAQFEKGEIYRCGDRFFEAERAVETHVLAHGDPLERLLGQDSKYLTLTENQQELLRLLHQGLSDKEIAARQGVTPSTVRHQKFMFREKAKQAKLYLAVYQLALRDERAENALIPIHGGAKMVDDRYLATEEEREKILDTFFSSRSPLKLKSLSSKEKKKLIILSEIAAAFEKERQYTEKEVNQLLENIYDDYVTLRRYLIEYGFLDRTTNCSAYWRK